MDLGLGVQSKSLNYKNLRHNNMVTWAQMTRNLNSEDSKLKTYPGEDAPGPSNRRPFFGGPYLNPVSAQVFIQTYSPRDMEGNFTCKDHTILYLTMFSLVVSFFTLKTCKSVDV